MTSEQLNYSKIAIQQGLSSVQTPGRSQSAGGSPQPAERIPNPSLQKLSAGLIFAHYGAWLMLILTSLFWYWSGMASLGVGYLMIGGSLVMIVLAIVTYSDRKLSIYHRISFLAAAVYPLLVILMTGIAIIWVKTLRY